MSTENRKTTSRIPPPYKGRQVNVCQNPNCKNFSTLPTDESKDPHYKKVAVAKLSPAIQCKSCSNIVTLKSNLAIHEEYSRHTHPLDVCRAARHTGYCCTNKTCQNYLRKLTPTKPAPYYRRRGATSTGNQRFQCKSCGRTFTVGSKKFREQVVNYRATHEMLFMELVHLAPLKRIAEKFNTSITDIHRKIDLFYERCVLFSNDREARLKNIPIGHLSLSTDRQDYIVNWTNRKDKRTTQLSAIGTACLETGYVFGMEVNFDPSIQLQDIVGSEEYASDVGIGYPFRRYARFWTPDEIQARKPANRRAAINTLDQIELRSINTEGDRSAYDLFEENRLPWSGGALVHSEYTQYAHFLRLKDLIGHAERIVFYTDQEAGIVNAVNHAFADRISCNEVVHILLAFDKTLTNDQRLHKHSALKAILKQVQISCGYPTIRQAELRLIADGLIQPIAKGKSGYVGSTNIWYPNPVHRNTECDKMIAFSKSADSYPFPDRVLMSERATLNPIDTFFNQLRNRVTYASRNVVSAAENRRIWHKLSAYQPSRLYKTIQIFRTYRNYCLPNREGSTPAQRLGLAKGRVRINEIIG